MKYFWEGCHITLLWGQPRAFHLHCFKASQNQITRERKSYFKFFKSTFCDFHDLDRKLPWVNRENAYQETFSIHVNTLIRPDLGAKSLFKIPTTK